MNIYHGFACFFTDLSVMYYVSLCIARFLCMCIYICRLYEKIYLHTHMPILYCKCIYGYVPVCIYARLQIHNSRIRCSMALCSVTFPSAQLGLKASLNRLPSHRTSFQLPAVLQCRQRAGKLGTPSIRRPAPKCKKLSLPQTPEP